MHTVSVSRIRGRENAALSHPVATVSGTVTVQLIVSGTTYVLSGNFGAARSGSHPTLLTCEVPVRLRGGAARA